MPALGLRSSLPLTQAACRAIMLQWRNGRASRSSQFLGGFAMIHDADNFDIAVYGVGDSLEKTILFFYTKETAQQYYENATKNDDGRISPVLQFESQQDATRLYLRKEWVVYTQKPSHPDIQKVFIQNTIAEFSCLDIANLIELSESLNKAINSRKELIRRQAL